MNGLPDHPAKFSKSVATRLAWWIDEEQSRSDWTMKVLDVMGGIGGIHRLPFETGPETFYVEIEPEWAKAAGGIVGDATRLPFTDESIDIAATSCCYGNRMADTYLGDRDRCTWCGGCGAQETEADGRCAQCAGTGYKPSQRRTYAVSLGRRPAENSAGAMQWGPAYRDLHIDAWSEVVRVLKPGGLFLLSVSDHIRGGTRIKVAKWHADNLLAAGYRMEAAEKIETPRMRHGQNHQARVDGEWLFVFRDPRQSKLG